MTPSHPRPLPEAPLVEAWGVRDARQRTFPLVSPDAFAVRDYRDAPGGTVVPLIAADRLTSPEVVDAVCREVDPTWDDIEDPRREPYRAHVRALLAALRTLLEEA